MMSAPLRIALRLLLPVILAVAVAVAAPAGAADPPAVPVRHLVARELWRVPAEGDDYLVSAVIDVVTDPRGDICLADNLQKCAFVFTRDGRYVRTLGRAGEGPGESRDVRAVFLDGERYGLVQVVPAAIVWLNGDGTPAGKVTIARAATEGESFASVAWARLDGGRRLAWLNRSRFADGRIVPGDEGVVEVAPDGTVGPLLYRQPEEGSARTADGIDEGKVHDIWMRRWCGDGRGGVWVAPVRDRYVLQRWGPDGRMLQEVSLPYDPVVRTSQARESILAWMKQRGWRQDQVTVGRTAPVVAGLRLAADGRLWVALDLGRNVLDGDVRRVYDVFDGEGRRVEQVRVHGLGETTSLVVLDDATMVGLVDGEDGADEQWLVLEGLEPVAALPGTGR